jgi:hypothetical protein
MRRNLAVLLFLPALSLALPSGEALKVWSDAYEQGYEDGYKQGVQRAKDFCFYLQGAEIFDKLLINGVIPPPKIEAKWKLVSSKEGLRYERKLVVSFKPVSMEELMQYKEFAQYLQRLEKEKENLPAGYYYLVLDTPLPKSYKGLIVFAVKKTFGGSVAVGVEKDGKLYVAKADTLEDIKFIKNRLTKLLQKIGLEVSFSVEKI